MNEVLYPKESYKIVGAVYEVHKHLGPGLLEKVYQEALEQEFLLQGIPFEREKEFEVIYKGTVLNQKYIADFVCYNKIIVELKSVEELIPFHTAQVLNYLNITGLRLGLLVNFNVRKVVPRRIVKFDDCE
jgi:GxxExxY protein